MVDSFKGKLTEETHPNIKHFYMLVPPLILNFIQSLLIAKEKLVKKNFKGGYISDDGFVLGLAYLIEMLGQKKQLESLHWFEEVIDKLKAEIKVLEEKFSKADKEKQSAQGGYLDDQSVELRINLRQKVGFLEEFELLENCFKASKILFRNLESTQQNFFSDEKDEEESVEKKEEEKEKVE